MLKEGDVVQLKSGGPLMTIISKYDNNAFNCTWFDGTTPKSSVFPETALEEYKTPSFSDDEY